MHPYAIDVVLKQTERGEWRFESHGNGTFSSKPVLHGKVVTETGDPHILAPNGLKVPIYKNSKGQWVTRSYSCSTSAAFILETFFGLRIDGSSARQVESQIKKKLFGNLVVYGGEP
ncbi:MAG: hypothetical protein N2578_06935 [Bdellovibrionaceae bacterium]|nr:hypothetical protein [Pseudobdellovibrionaceae bacterium]